MSAPLTLLFILKDLQMGGAEKSMLTTANTLAEQGHRVSLLVWKNEGALRKTIHPSITLEDEPQQSGFFQALRHTYRIIKRHKQAKVISALLKPNVAASLSGLLLGRRRDIYITEHSNIERYLADKPFLPRAICASLVRFSYRAAGTVLSVTDANARIAEKTGNLPPNSIQTVGNPIDCHEPANDTAQPANWPDTDSPIILAIGRLEPVKNFAFLIESLAALHQNHNINAHLVLVGEGSEKASLIKLAKSNNLLDYFHLLRESTDLSAHYHHADLLASTSHHESFSMVILEAMWHGLPVIATDSPTGPRAISQDGKLINLTPPNDLISFTKELAQTIKTRHLDEKQNDCRAHARLFSPQHIAARYETILRS